MSLQEILQKNRQSILQAAKRHGAMNVRLFGSVARGEEDEFSDIDFLVDMEPGRSLFDLGALLSDLESLLHHPVDVVTQKGIKKRLLDRIMNEAVPL
ncbi:MAG: nucleotidyltransferase family protein [Deltaproteobacteria bacterium]|nr:nucleotidyltransferase family protein [Deltaproteobacteria bacterium]